MTGVVAASAFYTGRFTGNFTIASNTANVNWTTLLTNAGWNGTTPVNTSITVNSGVVVYSTSTGTEALKQGGAFPAGSTASIVNAGTVTGKGGAGGVGGGDTGSANGVNGAVGGIGITIDSAVSIDNTGGIIAGGGGGGGGGGYASGVHTVLPDVFSAVSSGSGGGGGGGSSISAAAAGAGGTATTGTTNTLGGNATAGGNTGSAGGTRAIQASDTGCTAQGGTGGAGGDRGVAGTAATNNATHTGDSGVDGTPGAGGAAGKYLTGNSNVTWVANGTRLGSSS